MTYDKLGFSKQEKKAWIGKTVDIHQKGSEEENMFNLERKEMRKDFRVHTI